MPDGETTVTISERAPDSRADGSPTEWATFGGQIRLVFYIWYTDVLINYARNQGSDGFEEPQHSG